MLWWKTQDCGLSIDPGQLEAEDNTLQEPKPLQRTSGDKPNIKRALSAFQTWPEPQPLTQEQQVGFPIKATKSKTTPTSKNAKRLVSGALHVAASQTIVT